MNSIPTLIEFFRSIDTSPLAMMAFGRPVERAVRSRCAAAFRAGTLDINSPYGLPVEDRPERTSNALPESLTAIRSVSFKVLRGIGYAHLWYVLVVALLLFVYRSVDPPVTVLMTYRAVVDGWDLAPHSSVPLSKIPSLARRMVVSVEDGRFYQHGGIDLEAVRYAMEVNKQIGRPLYGGSTLTMQTARTLFLVPFKSYLRKYLEVIATLEMETILPKNRILEIYLSWAEWGKGVFGLEAAARKFYGRSASRLSVDQTARLVALLSSPIRFTPSTVHKSGILRSRYQYLIQKYGSS